MSKYFPSWIKNVTGIDTLGTLADFLVRQMPRGVPNISAEGLLLRKQLKAKTAAKRAARLRNLVLARAARNFSGNKAWQQSNKRSKPEPIRIRPEDVLQQHGSAT